MDVKVIKLDEEHIEVDGVRYKRESGRRQAWCDRNQITETSSVTIKPYKDMYISFGLPNANRDWTFQTFDAIKRCCEYFPNAYPDHGIGDGNNQIIVFVGRD